MQSVDCSLRKTGEWGWGTLGNGCTLVKKDAHVEQDDGEIMTVINYKKQNLQGLKQK
jgi:hypothetical protein